ncbi:MAG: MarR family transcriptional regulator [Actinobacteria bacterium]|nr:MarR family transcriptional regulator [Actinomycetota bacterium]
MDAGTEDSRVDDELLDALGALIVYLLGQGEQVARGCGVPTVFIKALHWLDGPLPMKELGRRMHCDPSFVTSVADMLASRGLATREADPADRRVKRLVLTADGRELKQRVASEVQARMPWRETLDPSEQACLLGLIRKMLPTEVRDAGLPALREAMTGGEHRL